MLLQGQRGEGLRGREAEMVVHLWSMPLLLPPSLQDHLVTEEARGDKEKETVQKSTLL